MKQGWSSKDCPLKVFAMSNVAPLSKVKALELAEADIVICSYRLLFSEIYLKRRKEIGNGWAGFMSLMDSTKKLRDGKGEVTAGRKTDSMAKNFQELSFPVLEMFYWNRIVYDEFHELESFDSLQQNSLQHMRSHYRWGLTGTPPIDCNAGVIFMSSLFRIDLPGWLEDPRLSGGSCQALTTWEIDRQLTEMAGRFLDTYVRQNTAELPHIRLEEQVVIVQHSAAERALYLGQAHEAPDFADPGAFASQANITALERVLKLCSHFQVGGADVMSNAQDECERIGAQKERRVASARNQVIRVCRAMFLLERKLEEAQKSHRGKEVAEAETWREALTTEEEKMKLVDSGQEVVLELQKHRALALVQNLVQHLDHLDAHRPKDEGLAVLLGPQDPKLGFRSAWQGLVSAPMSVRDCARLLAGQALEQAQNLRELREAATSEGFFRRTVSALAEGSADARSCSVCLGDGFGLDKLAITPCAHSFCMDCLRSIVENFKSCSICRHPLSLRDVRPLCQELQVETPAAEASGGSSSSSSAPAKKEQEPDMSSHGKYGTKLAVVVQKLLKLRQEDSTAKVILFVQFDDLKRKVASALAEFGVPCATLQGGVGQRANIIRDWQYNASSQTFVLLLSLAQSASGTNLTAASHVVFLHPMLAPTAERAVGYELQAIGRARRHGQLRDAVHVWRFVTAGTVEQTITERHQSTLWQQEQARRQAPPPVVPAVAPKQLS